MIFLASLTIATLTFLLVLMCIVYFRKRWSTDIFVRMRRHTAADSKYQPRSKETFFQTFSRFIQQIAKPFTDKKIFAPLDIKLRQAGIPFTGSEFTVATLILMAAVGIFVYMLTINRVLAILTCLLVPIGLWATVLIMIRKRKISFTEQLGDCLVTFANALRAGYSFQQAMDVIAKEMESPISQEFAKVSTDIKMGVPLENALEQMNKRVESADLELMITAVLIQREVGGNLAQILDSISDTIMERIRMKREINALTAQGRLSALILLFLPFALGIFMYTVNPGQMKLLFEETSGQIALGVSIIMDIIGFVIIQRIVSIDV